MTFKHSYTASMVLYSVPLMLSFAHRHDTKISLYLQSGTYDATHKALTPLLASQEAFETVKTYQGERLEVDLDTAIEQGDWDKGHIARHYFYFYEGAYPLASPWLWVTPLPGFHDRLVVNRTLRLRGNVDYQFMNDYDPLFLGDDLEYQHFRRDVPNSTHVKTEDLLQAAQLIAGCKCFVGNHSSCFAIAEALKVPRCLEECTHLRNLQPQGGDARAAANPPGFEWNVRDMMK